MIGISKKEIIEMLPSQRALFDMPRHICYLNSASYSPLPLRTQEAGRAAVRRKAKPWTLEPSFANNQHERARAAAARLINADPADIALIPSISYGVATAAKVLTIDRGARIIVLEDDHSSPVLEWQARANAQALLSRRFVDRTTATGHLRFSRPSSGPGHRRSALPRSHRCTGRTAG